MEVKALGFAAIGVVITLIGFGLANRIESSFLSFLARIVALLAGFFSMSALHASMNATGTSEAIVYWVFMLAGLCLLPKAFGAETRGFSLGWFVLVFCLLLYSIARSHR